MSSSSQYKHELDSMDTELHRKRTYKYTRSITHSLQRKKLKCKT